MNVILMALVVNVFKNIKIMKLIKFIYCMAYGFTLGTIMVALPMLMLEKLQITPVSDVIKYITYICLLLVTQLFYIKTYKWLIY